MGGRIPLDQLIDNLGADDIQSSDADQLNLFESRPDTTGNVRIKIAVNSIVEFGRR